MSLDPKPSGPQQIVGLAFNYTAPHLPVFLINLNQSLSRFQSTKAQLEQAEVRTWTRISAVYQNEVKVSDVRTWTRTPAVHGDEVKFRPRTMHPRNAAVAHSHMQAWRAVLATQQPAAIVLEDDMLLQPKFAFRATTLLQRAARRLGGLVNIDMLHLSLFRHLTNATRCIKPLDPPRGPIPPRARRLPLIRLRCAAGLNTGMGAYMITRHGATRALKELTPIPKPTKHIKSFDLMMGRASIRLNRFAPSASVHDLARHDWKIPSVRVHGLAKLNGGGGAAPPKQIRYGKHHGKQLGRGKQHGKAQGKQRGKQRGTGHPKQAGEEHG